MLTSGWLIFCSMVLLSGMVIESVISRTKMELSAVRDDES
jgi:hypothetical protein